MTDDRTFQAGKDSEPETSAEVSANDKYVLRLYVSGQSPRSILAIENMRKICAEYLSERYPFMFIRASASAVGRDGLCRAVPAIPGQEAATGLELASRDQARRLSNGPSQSGRRQAVHISRPGPT